MTCQPDGPWVEQQARNFAMDLVESGEKVSHLLKDGDTKFTDEIFKTEGIRVKRLPFASPNALCSQSRTSAWISSWSSANDI